MNRLSKIILSLILFLSFTAAAVFYLKRPFSNKLAAFVTDLSARSFPQRENIRKVGRMVSGVILQPGETFSLNETAGPFTPDRGFLPERSFLDKKVATTDGGGVCQLASTLYNAARLSGLKILERIPHSLKVDSVPPGYDATIAYGVSDLKFKNPHPFPIKIVSKISQDQLKLEIWGKELSHEHSRL